MKYIKFSFTLTYILLLTTGLITFVEALRTKDESVRHIMNLETCISIVAGYFYGSFINEVSSSSNPQWKQISSTRYTDWCITTPMMLLALCIVLSTHVKKKLKLHFFITIVALNYCMLYIGFLGEINKIDKLNAMIMGFFPFIVMFGLIYYQYVSSTNYVLFVVYGIVWSLYGLVYMLDEIKKNIAFNTLDFISKCFIGLGLWAYYTKIIVS